MRRLVAWAAAVGMVLCLWAGPAAATRRKSTAKKPTAKSATASKKPAAPKTTWRNRQTAPTPDRYRDIQQALAAKGYLPAEQVTGRWNDESADAMKRFQADQKLDANGKINSRSLIALGLGPKHEAEAEVKPPAPAAPASDKPGQ